MSTNEQIARVIAAQIKYQRGLAKLDQADLAEVADVTTRQIGRYENAEQVPAADKMQAMADRMGISVAALYRPLPKGPDLNGLWYTSCFVTVDDIRRVDTNSLYLVQDGDLLIMDAERAQGDQALEVGDYAYTGELRLHRATNILTGWYESDDSNVNAAGSYFFALHPKGTYGTGRWDGKDLDGIVCHDWATIARTKEVAEQLLSALEHHQGNLPTWPKLSKTSP